MTYTSNNLIISTLEADAQFTQEFMSCLEDTYIVSYKESTGVYTEGAWDTIKEKATKIWEKVKEFLTKAKLAVIKWITKAYIKLAQLFQTKLDIGNNDEATIRGFIGEVLKDKNFQSIHFDEIEKLVDKSYKYIKGITTADKDSVTKLEDFKEEISKEFKEAFTKKEGNLTYGMITKARTDKELVKKAEESYKEAMGIIKQAEGSHKDGEDVSLAIKVDNLKKSILMDTFSKHLTMIRSLGTMAIKIYFKVAGQVKVHKNDQKDSDYITKK